MRRTDGPKIGRRFVGPGVDVSSGVRGELTPGVWLDSAGWWGCMMGSLPALGAAGVTQRKTARGGCGQQAVLCGDRSLEGAGREPRTQSGGRAAPRVSTWGPLILCDPGRSVLAVGCPGRVCGVLLNQPPLLPQMILPRRGHCDPLPAGIPECWGTGQGHRPRERGPGGASPLPLAHPDFCCPGNQMTEPRRKLG